MCHLTRSLIGTYGCPTTWASQSSGTWTSGVVGVDAPTLDRYCVAMPLSAGKKRMPRFLPDYYSPGEESEAKHVAVSLRAAWKGHRESVAWLKAQS